MIVHVRKFKMGEVGKLSHAIEQTPGDLSIAWTIEDGWHVGLHLHDRGHVYLHRTEDVRRLAEFLRRRAPGNRPTFVEISKGLLALADLVDQKREAGELPPNALAHIPARGNG